MTETSHGTLTGYSVRRCRCEDCRKAWNAYTRNLNHTKRLLRCSCKHENWYRHVIQKGRQREMCSRCRLTRFATAEPLRDPVTVTENSGEVIVKNTYSS